MWIMTASPGSASRFARQCLLEILGCDDRAGAAYPFFSAATSSGCRCDRTSRFDGQVPNPCPLPAIAWSGRSHLTLGETVGKHPAINLVRTHPVACRRPSSVMTISVFSAAPGSVAVLRLMCNRSAPIDQWGSAENESERKYLRRCESGSQLQCDLWLHQLRSDLVLRSQLPGVVLRPRRHL